MATSNVEKWVPPPDPSEHHLACAANGDVGAFAAIVERYQRMAYSVAYKVLGNRADAEDAAQEAFLRCHRALAQFRGESSFSTWFFRLVLGAAADVKRREQRQPRPCVLPETISSDSDDVSRASVLVAALRALPDDYRIPTVLRDVYGLPYRDIARITDKPLGTAKVMVHRGRAALRLRLRAEGLGPDDTRAGG